MDERIRFISKEGRRWKIKHCDGVVTYHKTLKAAKAYEHTIVNNPLLLSLIHSQNRRRQK